MDWSIQVEKMATLMPTCAAGFDEGRRDGEDNLDECQIGTSTSTKAPALPIKTNLPAVNAKGLMMRRLGVKGRKLQEAEKNFEDTLMRLELERYRTQKQEPLSSSSSGKTTQTSSSRSKKSMFSSIQRSSRKHEDSLSRTSSSALKPKSAPSPTSEDNQNPRKEDNVIETHEDGEGSLLLDLEEEGFEADLVQFESLALQEAAGNGGSQAGSLEDCNLSRIEVSSDTAESERQEQTVDPSLSYPIGSPDENDYPETQSNQPIPPFLSDNQTTIETSFEIVEEESSQVVSGKMPLIHQPVSSSHHGADAPESPVLSCRDEQTSTHGKNVEVAEQNDFVEQSTDVPSEKNNNESCEEPVEISRSKGGKARRNVVTTTIHFRKPKQETSFDTEPTVNMSDLVDSSFVNEARDTPFGEGKTMELLLEDLHLEPDSKAASSNESLSEQQKLSQVPKGSPKEPAMPTTLPQIDDANLKQKKPMWKAATDPSSGKTYYYHRKSRETTWEEPIEPYIPLRNAPLEVQDIFADLEKTERRLLNRRMARAATTVEVTLDEQQSTQFENEKQHRLSSKRRQARSLLEEQKL